MKNKLVAVIGEADEKIECNYIQTNESGTLILGYIGEHGYDVQIAFIPKTIKVRLMENINKNNA